MIARRHPRHTWPARLRGVLLAGLMATTWLVGGASPARADGALQSVSVTTSTQQAGAHPDMDVALTTASGTYINPVVSPTLEIQDASELAKSFVVNLPPGMLGNPTSFPTCDDTTIYESPTSCPPGAQVGVLTLHSGGPGFSGQNPDGSFIYTPYATDQAPVFNMPPGPGDVARLGIPEYNGDFPIHVDIAVRDTSDFGLTATVSGIPTALEFFYSDLQLWGVPSAADHDSERVGCWNGYNIEFTAGCTQSVSGSATYLVNPTSCGAAPSVTASAQFYGDPQTYDASTQMAPTTGCGALAFSPSLSLTPQTGAVGQPDGYTADLTVPQPAIDDPLAADTSAAVDDVSVTLPQGVSLSPGVANGLGACSDAQFGQGSDAAAACPSDSSIGTVTVDTPLLSTPLTGALYVGEPESSDPTSGEMYRVFLDATGQGVDLKLVGSVSANPSTGQLTASFPQNPQVPFSNLQLSFDGGANAPLANPPVCGTATSNWTMTSYAAPATPVSGESSFPVSGDCTMASQFTPTLRAGTQSDRAGGSSPFSFTITRPDGQQDIAGIPQITLPKGLIAAVKGVSECVDASACTAASQVGSATITAGAGAAPFSLQGQPVYLTGPYEGAPYGLAVVVRAVAGPYDLGTVVVRQALFINPTTAQVTVKSDPLPVIVGGVPLHIRTISVDIDRPGFMRSPTSCAAQSITAQVTSAPLQTAATVAAGTFTGYATQSGLTARLSTPFQMGGCAALPFAPRLSIALAATHRTAPGGHPRLTATLTQRPGQANLDAVRVALPLSLALDPDNSQHVCSVKAAARIACPRRTIVGHATADTRILPHPLSGNIYLVQGVRHGRHGQTIRTLPHLLIPLRGRDHVKIDLRAVTSVNADEQLVTTFEAIPDAAIARVRLTIAGGTRGILVVTGDHGLCDGGQIAGATETGQNGKTHEAALGLHIPACP